VHQLHVLEMTEENCRSRERLRDAGGNRHLLRDETTWSRGVDDEVDVQLEMLMASTPSQLNAVVAKLRVTQLGPIAIVHARGDRLAHEMMVHIGAKPMCVRDSIVGTRGDEQSLRREAVSIDRRTGM